MKVFVVFTVFLAAVSAIPEFTLQNSKYRGMRFVDDLMSAAIEELSKRIVEAELDPWNFDKYDEGFELPVPVLLSLHALVDTVKLTGLSNIVVNSVSFGTLSGRLDLDVSLPKIELSVDEAAFNVTLLAYNFNGRTNSRLSIIQPRISGTIQINVLGVIIGPLVRSINLEFDLEAIEYEGSLKLVDMEVGEFVRFFISDFVVGAIKNVKAEINELIEIIAWEVVEYIGL